MAWRAILTWTLSPSDPALVQGQRVERRVGTLGAWESLGTVPPTQDLFTDAGPLNEGVEYGYRVVAFNPAGEAASPEVVGTPLAVPLAPSGLAVAFSQS